MVDVFHPSESVIASWPTANYVNPQTHGPGLVIVCILLSALGIIVVLVRLYARAFVTRALGIDDCLIVLATVFAVALAVLNILGSVLYYSDHHIWDIPTHIFVPHRINVWISEICVTMALSLTKISILLFYRRLSVSFSRKFLIAVWVGIVYNILYMISFVLAICLLCRPLSAFWNEFNPVYYEEHPHQCGHERIMEPLTAVLSSVSDAYTTILPIILITRLDMPVRQKRALFLLFGLGFLVVITGIVRIAWLYLTLTVDYDFTWRLWEMWILSEVEMWVAIYAASAPALKPMVKKLAAVLGYRFTVVSERIKGLYSTTNEKSGKGSKQSTTELGDGTESTADFEMGKGIVMSNGEIKYTVKSRYSGSAMQDLHVPSTNAPPRVNHWRRDGSWNRVESPESFSPAK